jgi:hypothetical protein
MTPVDLDASGPRSTVPVGAKFAGGRWRQVARLVDVVDDLSVDVFGDDERGFVTYFPRIEGLIG